MSHSKKENIEKFILVVKNHPILYDMTLPDFKNIRQKDYVWDNVISPEMNGENGEILKTKWKNLRDSYQKHLKSIVTTTGQAEGASKGKLLDPYKNWIRSKHLEFLKPHVKFAATKSNVSEIINRPEDSSNDIDGRSDETVNVEDDISSEILPQINNACSTSKKLLQNNYNKNQPVVSNIDKVLEHLNKKQKTTSSSLDAVELVMLGHAKTLKTLSAKRQAIAKKKIAELIGDLEIEQIEENEKYQYENEHRSLRYQHENELSHQSAPSHYSTPVSAINLSNQNSYTNYNNNYDVNYINME